MDDSDGLKDDLSQCGCDACDQDEKHQTACRRAQSYILRMCLSVFLKMLLSSYTLRSHFVRDLLYQEMYSLQDAYVFCWCVLVSAMRTDTSCKSKDFYLVRFHVS